MVIEGEVFDPRREVLRDMMTVSASSAILPSAPHLPVKHHVLTNSRSNNPIPT